MFIGHYAVALAAKKAAPQKSLVWSFIAVQFLDVLWAPAILAGIEHVRIVPGFLPASSLDLYDMPWTHSLVMALIWSWFFFRLTKSRVLGVCVFSHWILDFIAHGPDLPLLRGGPKYGLGLWRFREGTLLVESALLIAGLIVYLRATRPKNAVGRYGMIAFAAFLIVCEVWNLYGAPPPSAVVVAVLAEVSYVVFAAIAAWLDRAREPL